MTQDKAAATVGLDSAILAAVTSEVTHSKTVSENLTQRLTIRYEHSGPRLLLYFFLLRRSQLFIRDLSKMI